MAHPPPPSPGPLFTRRARRLPVARRGMLEEADVVALRLYSTSGVQLHLLPDLDASPSPPAPAWPLLFPCSPSPPPRGMLEEAQVVALRLYSTSGE
jgi:hypothetical protein